MSQPESHNGKMAEEWEKRSRKLGDSMKSVLFKGLPDAVNMHLHNWHLNMVLDNIQPQAGMNILDVGCGFGRISQPLSERYPDAHIIGVDLSPHYIELYKERTGRPAFLGNVKNLPAEIGPFDYIICITVLMYLRRTDLQDGVSSLMGRLKTGGRLLLIEPNSSGKSFQTAFGLRTLFRRRSGNSEFETGGCWFTGKEVRNAAFNVGGMIAEQFGIPMTTLCFLPMYVVAKGLPETVSKGLFKLIAVLDRCLHRFPLPSFSSAYVIVKK